MQDTQPNRKRTLRLLVALLVFRLVWAGLFAVATPLWEHFDEINHYYVVRYRGGISDERPDLTLPPHYRIFSQFDQPPLYHMLTGWLVRGVDDGTSLTITANPQPFCAYPQGNHFYIHDLPNEAPFQAAYRGIWMARTITLLIGVASAGVVWLAARSLWPYYPQRAWLATVLYVAFAPGAALSSWLNNDAPLMLFGGLVVVVLARWQQYGMSRHTVGLLAVVWVLGIGTKLNMLAVLPAIVLVGVDTVRRRATVRRWHVALAISGIALLLLMLIGINFGLCGRGLCRTHRPLTGENLSIVTQDFVGNYMPQAFAHLIQTLGSPTLNSAYPPRLWMMMVMMAILVVGVMNALLRAWEAPYERRPVVLLITLIAGALALALVRVWWLKVGFMPLRYFAVVFPALILLLSVGYHLLAARGHPVLGALPIVAFIVVGVATLQVSYRPLWQYPEQRDVLPADVTPVAMHFENGLDVAGYTIDGDTVTFYLTTDTALTEPLAMEVALLDSTGGALSHCEMLAGHPIWPTNRWQPGQYVVQRVSLNGIQNSQQPLFLRIRFAPLLNAVYLDNQPDYAHELQVTTGVNLIPHLP